MSSAVGTPCSLVYRYVFRRKNTAFSFRAKMNLVLKAEKNTFPRNIGLWTTKVQGKHKVFPWLQAFITRKLRGHVGTLCCVSVSFVSAVDNFPTRWRTSTPGFIYSSVFGCNISKQVDWERWSDTLGHHDHRISSPLTYFYGGMLRTKCLGHQFQILQIWKARITETFATITEDILENTWR